jgi:hypothetical protein
MKIVEFSLIIWGKWPELEPEPEFLTSWSRSLTKMYRNHNTDNEHTVRPGADQLYFYMVSFLYGHKIYSHF